MALPPDWTHTGAKWIAALLLGGASLAGMAWSLSSRKPVIVHPREPSAPPAPAPSTVGLKPELKAEPPKSAPIVSLPPSEETRAQDLAPERAPGVGHKVNLNTATQAELELLPGIGPALAQRILEFRAANGAFATIDQLDKVKGIGPRTLAKLRPLVSVE